MVNSLTDKNNVIYILEKIASLILLTSPPTAQAATMEEYWHLRYGMLPR